MSKAIIFRALLISLLSINCMDTFAQCKISLYSDIGKNNVSEGLFLKSALIGSFKFKKTTLSTAIQADLKNNIYQGLTGYYVDASRIIMNKESTLEIKGFCIFTYPSAIVMESNLGALIKMSHKRFKMEIGSNFKTYSLRQNSGTDYSGVNSPKIREISNIIYSFNYYLKPTDDKWNLGLAVTNIDQFIINQETNPVFNLNGKYKLSVPITIYAQAWYKCAGVTNLELNHFGYFFRTGIIWNIN